MYTNDDDDDDEEEEAANAKARKGGVSDDPFKKRIPKAFYDKESKKFPSLPKNWEVGYSGPKPYFAE